MPTLGVRLLAGGLAAALFGACHARRPEPDLPVVPKVDLARYAGVWHEIARYPHRFQQDCYASQATYTPRSDGRIDVLNECRQGAPDGPRRTAEGVAAVADPTTNAKLRVSFFWPFYGDYWVIDLGPEYEYAVVGHPSRKYLWILSRTPTLPPATYEAILARLRAVGYDTDKLIRAGRASP